MMYAHVLLSIAALAVQTFASPTTHYPLVARQGYVSNCTSTYIIRPGDNCNKIVDFFNDTFTLTQFHSWNSEVDPVCSNLSQGEVVCVGVNSFTPKAPACPVPVKAGLAGNCNKCHKVVQGETCSAIETANNVTLADFRKWNTDIDSGCGNLEVGYSYCVGAVAK
ncbi:hypothetical protein GGR57DRAFT_437350 [Xylariaceae sp. FL1272]|nr:hypothetical protein GGR57DRAFT_437350 [Xylariaceae sp. FL1272]